MEQLLSIIFHGFLIGILISAPMGPIGALCIQRTLNKGQWAGFFTGIGAGLSDLIYCLLTGLGMSFIIGFIEENQLTLQILGSLVLVIFALYIIYKNPAGRLKTPHEKKKSYTQDFITGFLFTFSNPLILFLIIGLFARFNFMQHELNLYYSLAGFASIFTGALVWWFIITYFVSAVRNHFNLRSLWLVNRIIGALILLMSLFGLIWGIRDFLLK